MRPLTLIPIALLIVPIAEIVVFILVGERIGVLWTLALVFLTAVIGTFLLRWQGFSLINRIRLEADAGRIPGRELGHGAMIMVAGVLLLTPGFVTDALGFTLFVPPVRDAIWNAIAARLGGPPGPGPRRSQRRPTIDLDERDWRHEPDP